MIRNSSECELSAIVDPFPQAADYARELNVPVFKSLGDLFARDKPDGIFLATPNQMHVDQGLECIAVGVPALVEKPIADTLERGVELLKATEQAKAKMLVGHHRRYSSIMAKAVEVIASGVLGDIVAVVGTALMYKAESEGYFDGPFSWRRESGGGPDDGRRTIDPYRPFAIDPMDRWCAPDCGRRRNATVCAKARSRCAPARSAGRKWRSLR
jgi:predicted dehydrogenase